MKKKIANLSTALWGMYISINNVLCDTKKSGSSQAWTIGDTAGDNAFQAFGSFVKHWWGFFILLFLAIYGFTSDQNPMHKVAKKAIFVVVILVILSYTGGMDLIFGLISFVASLFGVTLQ